MTVKKKVGYIEAVFDVCYLVTAFSMGTMLLFFRKGSPVSMLAGVMALVLAGGDSFHLVPRILSIVSENNQKYQTALGRGKQIASITMTVFYIFLWIIGRKVYSLPILNIGTVVLFGLAFVRIFLCLLPQNKWTLAKPPVKWGVYRNIPFLLMGIMVAMLFFVNRSVALPWVWLVVLLSFLFYLPVVLWVDKSPKLGMLMLPKSCAYLSLLAMFLFMK